MPDDDQPEINLDWRDVTTAARSPLSARSDRQDRTAAGKQRRSLRGPSHTRPIAEMIAFPLNRRVAFVKRLAAQVASRPADAGEQHLLSQLARQRDALVRKGVTDRAIERELRALSRAVRAELWRLVLGGSE